MDGRIVEGAERLTAGGVNCAGTGSRPWRRNPLFWAGAVLLASAVVGVILIAANMTLYSDDYMYGTFFRQGPAHLWEMLKWHYLHFNGRTFVHLMAELVLVWDTKVFMFLEPLMLICVFALGCRIQNRALSWGTVLLVSGVGIWLTLSFPAVWLKESLFWLSAAFNYLFPICVLLFAFWLYQRMGERGRGLPLVLILSFLAGATTEQCGLAAFVCLFGWGALCWLRKTMPLWKGLLPAFVAGVGYLTVVFAPGTWVRVDNEVSEGVLSAFRLAVFPQRVAAALNYFIGSGSVPWLFIGFALLTAVHWLMTRKGPKLALLGLPAAMLYLLARCTGRQLLTDAVAVCYLLVVAAGYLRRPEHTARGLLILAALASQLVMIFNHSMAYRTVWPGIFLLLAVGMSLAGECLERCPAVPRVTAAVLAAALCVVAYAPTCRGYLANGEINRRNERALREGGALISIDLGLDDQYQHYMFYISPTFIGHARTYYGVTDQKITYVNAPWPVAGSYNGREAGLPICEKDGQPYGSVLDVALLCGGEGAWDYPEGGTVVEIGDACYLIRPNGDVYGWDPEARERTTEVFTRDVWKPWYAYYLPLETMEELFGVQYRYDQEENIYYLRALPAKTDTNFREKVE